jgi:hypothetical protein
LKIAKSYLGKTSRLNRADNLALAFLNPPVSLFANPIDSLIIRLTECLLRNKLSAGRTMIFVP